MCPLHTVISSSSTMTPPSVNGRVLGAFVRVLETIHKNADDVYWERVFEQPRDDPDHQDNFDADGKCKLTDEQRKRLINYSKMSLRRKLDMTIPQYNNMLILCGLLAERGTGYRLLTKKWEQVLPSIGIMESVLTEVELLKGHGKRYFLPLGPKPYVYESPKKQADEGAFDQPVLESIVTRDLRKALRDAGESLSESEEDKDTSGDDEDDGDSDSGVSLGSDDEDSDFEPDIITNSKYPVMMAMGIMASELTDLRIEAVIGELVRLQRHRAVTKLAEHPSCTASDAIEATSADATPTSTSTPAERGTPKAAKKSKATAFTFCQAETIYTAVPIPRHKDSDDDYTFKRYQDTKPYLREIVIELGKSRGSDKVDLHKGARRLLLMLAKHHPEIFVDVAKEFGLAVKRNMDAVGMAAWIEDAGLKDWQAKLSMKHLRYYFGDDVFDAFTQTKQFSKGFVVPQIGTVKHQYKDGKKDTITHEYQSFVKLAENGFGAILTTHEAKPSHLVRLDFAQGGDHAQNSGIKAHTGVFCVCIRLIATLKNGDLLHYDIRGAATVHCKKDTSQVLRKTILKKWTADLKTLNESKVSVIFYQRFTLSYCLSVNISQHIFSILAPRLSYRLLTARLFAK